MNIEQGLATFRGFCAKGLVAVADTLLTPAERIETAGKLAESAGRDSIYDLRARLGVDEFFGTKPKTPKP